MPDKQFSDPRLANLYDLGNAGSEDRDFYLELAGSVPIDILDLGCGTGLLCRAYSTAGHKVVGVDPASAMIDVAKRADPLGRVKWIESSAESFGTEQRFDLIIMTGHAFQVLLTDEQVSQTLAVMALLLRQDGRVVFESRNPAVDWDGVWAREYTMQTNDGPVHARRRLTDRSQAPDYLSFAWDYHFTDRVLTSGSTLRFKSHEQILKFANAAGLWLEHLYGDWDCSTFDPMRSREMIFQFRRFSPG